MQPFDIEERVRRSIGYFNEGYNCAQSVFMAYADLFEYPAEAAKAIASSFGGGIGRLRETCGTISAMAMLAGLQHPAPDPADARARTANYAVTRNMVKRFTNEYGTIKCGELLKIPVGKKEGAAPSERTDGYYAKRPCGRFVEHAARTAGQMLKGEITTEEE